MIEMGVRGALHTWSQFSLLHLVLSNCPVISNALGIQARNHHSVSMEQISIATLHGIEKEFRPLFSTCCKIRIKEMKHGLTFVHLNG